MTTFTSDDREEAYKKILEEAPNQPGYEDAVPIPFAGWVNASPPHIVDSGASVNALERSLAEEITEGLEALKRIRQLEAELIEAGGMIGALREHISDLEKGLDSSIKLNKAQAERNNEPVAWIDPYDLERLPLNDCWVNGEKSKWADLPLYTHPVKELTDEEIRAEWYNNCGKDDWFMDFARAILRKAQEK